LFVHVRFRAQVNTLDQEETPVLADARRSEIADLLRTTGSVTVAELEQRFGISSMTARRDLHTLEQQGLARRTHGGAMFPPISSHEDSFVSRVDVGVEAKEALATAAAATVRAGESVFLDGSSTALYVARALLERQIELTLITNSLPVMDAVATHPASTVGLVGIGGQLRPLSRSFVGPHAVHMALGHYADRCFLSVKGVTGSGAMTDADALEAEVKRAMVAHADHPVLLVDQTKLSARGMSVIGAVGDLAGVLVHGAASDELTALRAFGVPVKEIA
jgi:DeoR/GlpR family transcriptional regulator of sugar metabolism